MHIFLENQFLFYELWCILYQQNERKNENEKHQHQNIQKQQGDEDERS